MVRRLPRSAQSAQKTNYAQVAYDLCVKRACEGIALTKGAVKEIHRDLGVELDDFGIEIIMSDMMKATPHPQEW